MRKLWIIGLGPGHEDYILPIAKKKISEADLVIGGKRHLEHVEASKRVTLKIPLEENIDFIRKHMKDQQIAFLLSGDTGFYSMLTFIKKHFHEDDLRVYPGISSLQYLFSRINKTYENALLTSVHGRSLDFDKVVNYSCVGLLTDQCMTPKKILEECQKRNMKGNLYIGEDLSYPQERITKVGLNEEIEGSFSSLCVVVIEFE